jgi:hypothetical protein
LARQVVVAAHDVDIADAAATRRQPGRAGTREGGLVGRVGAEQCRDEVRARFAGPSARLRGDHCDSHAVSEVMRPIWLAA